MAKHYTKTGPGAVRDIWLAARRDLDEQAKSTPEDPNPNWPRNGIKPGKWDGSPHDKMPPDCPVRVVGADAEGKVWCRNALGDLVMIEKWDMATIARLFSPFINYAFWAWPAFGKVKHEEKGPDGEEMVVERLEVKRVERDKLFTCLANEASRRPLFDPEKQHRGRGGWVDSQNNFIWHSGKYLWRSDDGKVRNVEPGEHDGYLYTRQPSTIEPWDGPVTVAESPARRILEDLRTWNWERPYLDPILVLGWIVEAFAGGALKARPIIFTSGGAGVGKSTLQDLIKQVLHGVVFSSVNTSAAGIYQRMKQDSLPVMVDELESKPGNERAESVIELARVAYTGGNVDRGGADHKGISFGMHSAFFFSAINRPYLGEQDKTRMASLNLSRIAVQAGIGRKVLVREDADGRMILRQLMDGWRDFTGTRLQFWWDILAGQGLDSRAIDTYGTLLALAELAVGEEGLKACGLPVDDPAHLGAILGEATSVDRDEILDEWHKLTNHLISCTIDNWRDGRKPTIGGVMDEHIRGKLDEYAARDRLVLVNLGLRNRGSISGRPAGPYLCVPSSGPQLEKLFAGTAWHKGVWSATLKQAPKDIVLRDRQFTAVKIDGFTKRCLLIDMDAFQKYAAKDAEVAPVPVDDDVF